MRIGLLLVFIIGFPVLVFGQSSIRLVDESGKGHKIKTGNRVNVIFKEPFDNQDFIIGELKKVGDYQITVKDLTFPIKNISVIRKRKLIHLGNPWKEYVIDHGYSIEIIQEEEFSD